MFTSRRRYRILVHLSNQQEEERSLIGLVPADQAQDATSFVDLMCYKGLDYNYR